MLAPIAVFWAMVGIAGAAGATDLRDADYNGDGRISYDEYRWLTPRSPTVSPREYLTTVGAELYLSDSDSFFEVANLVVTVAIVSFLDCMANYEGILKSFGEPPACDPMPEDAFDANRELEHIGLLSVCAALPTPPCVQTAHTTPL